MKKKITVFWYSQTGQSFGMAKKAAEAALQAGAEAKIVPVSSSKDEDFSADALLFCFPVHTFKVPVTVQRRLDRLPALGGKVPAYLVLTYAGWPANAPWLFKKALAARNIRLDAYLCLRCRDSYIPFIKWLPFLNKKDLPDQSAFVALERFVKETVVPGKTGPAPRFLALDPMHWMGAASPENGPKMFLGPRVHDAARCTLCGLCVSLCPSGAITRCGDALSYNENLCLGCCGCLNACPQNAWQSKWFDPACYFKGTNVAEMARCAARRPGAA